MNEPLTKDKHPANYIPVLDGLRAIAILLVVLSHAGQGLEKRLPGTLGVLLFFVISGFLIAQQTLKETETTGTIYLGRFYTRRILRLLPALLAYLILFVPLLSYLGSYAVTPAQIFSGIFYANYYHSFIGYPLYSPMPILWSLSVEAHYYIAFPLLVLIFRRHPYRLLAWLCLLAILALEWRMAVYQLCAERHFWLCGLAGKPRIQGTDMVFDCILYGAILYIALQYNACRWLGRNTTFYLALLTLLACLIFRDAFFRATLRYSLEAGACATIIFHLLRGKHPLLSAFLSSPALLFIGRISYALYLVHFGVLMAIEAAQGKQHLASISAMAEYFILSFFLAICFYFLIEKPMIKIRRAFSAGEATV